MTPTRVQFNKGPVKYETPFFSTSASILRSICNAMARLIRVAESFRSVFGFVVLQTKHNAIDGRGAEKLTYRNMVSSIPSLLVSNSAFIQWIYAFGSSPESSWRRKMVDVESK